MKKILASCAFVFFSAQAQAATLPGCSKDGDFSTARFNRDCTHRASDGYFKIPKGVKVDCHIENGHTLFYFPKPGPKLTLDVPLSTLLSDVKDEKTVEVALAAGEEDATGRTCKVNTNGVPYADYLAHLKNRSAIGEVTKLSDTEYKLAKISVAQSKVTEDRYIKTGADGKVAYNVTCKSGDGDKNDNGCKAEGPGIADGRYLYSVDIPAGYASRAFDIMDAVDALLLQAYVSDSAK